MKVFYCVQCFVFLLQYTSIPLKHTIIGLRICAIKFISLLGIRQIATVALNQVCDYSQTRKNLNCNAGHCEEYDILIHFISIKNANCKNIVMP